MTNAIAASDFLDRKLNALREEHSRELAKFERAPSRPLLRAATDYREALKAAFKPGFDDGAKLPWGNTHGLVAFRKGEVTVWAGMNGSGKSLVIGQCCLDWVHQGERVALASFEMHPVRVLKRMARQAQGSRNPSEGFLDHLIDWLSIDKRFMLVDHRGEIDAKKIFAEARYAAEHDGATQFVIDNMGQVVAGEENFDQQKDFVTGLTRIAADTGMHIHLLHHIRKGDDVNAVPDIWAVKGSGAITDFVDNAVLCWKNRKKIEARSSREPVDESTPDGMLRIVKQRNGEWEGKVALWHDAESLAFRAQQVVGWRRGYDIEVRE